MRLAMMIQKTNSFESIMTMPMTLAPSTFRMPISFVRLSAMKEASPKRPRQAITMATPEK